MASFTNVVRARVAHAPVAPTESDARKERDLAREANAVELELVAVATNQGTYAEFHPTKASPSEQLPEGLVRNCVGFLL